MIDWNGSTTSILVNPRSPDPLPKLPLEGAFSHHFWIRTSGTSGGEKWVALSKEAILHSAEAVNTHLNCTSKEIWLHALPDFHVGGLGILARAHLSGATVRRFADRWDPKRFHQMLEGCTLSALVPSQLYDLVKLRLKPPKSLRCLIIGGASLSDFLFEQAKALHWPICPSYGLTECASQVATAFPGEKEMRILPHVEVKSSHPLSLKSASLLTAYASLVNQRYEIADPKIDDVFVTEDLAQVSGPFLKVLGRTGDAVKIGGEFVNLLHLEAVLERSKLLLGLDVDAALVILPDPRLENRVHMCTTGSDTRALVQLYNENVYPYEQIRKVHYFQKIPRSPLGKVSKSLILSQLN
ncbi:MAG: AMP-binding protein [Waddliaceae bacterium]